MQMPWLLRPLFRRFSAAIATATATPTAASAAACADGGRVALYFRRARLIDSLRLRLRSSSHSSAPASLASLLSSDPVVAVNALRCAPSPESALALFRSLPAATVPTSVLHAVAARLALARRVPDLQSLLSAWDAGGFPSALRPPLLHRLRWLCAARDQSSSLQLWSSIRSSAVKPYGRRSHRGHPCTESYNLVMDLYADSGDHASAISTFGQMVREGAVPNSRTYTVLIDHLVRYDHLDAAAEVFYLLPSMRVRRTTKQYNVLAEAYSSTGKFNELQKLIKEMDYDGILPGRSMRDAMMEMQAAGHTEGIEHFVEQLAPNDRIGYAVDSAEGDGTEEDDDEEGGGNSDVKQMNSDVGNKIPLKPWLDPAALARALEDWEPSEVAELEAAKIIWTSRLVCKLLRAFKKVEMAWNFFCWVAYQTGGFAHDHYTVSRMITILARHGHVELVDRLLVKVKSEAIQLPFATVRLVIDFYGLSKKADAAVKVFREADSICGALSTPHRLLLCSSLLRTLVKCRRGIVAMELLEEMMLEGCLPDIQTFSGLMQYFAGIGDLKNVHKLFGMVRQCQMEPDAYMYVVLIQAYCKQERAALALKLFEEMRSSGLMPDRATRSLLVKSLWKEGKLREAAIMEEKCEEIDSELPLASPGHAWTVSATDFKRIYDIYYSSFAENDREK